MTIFLSMLSDPFFQLGALLMGLFLYRALGLVAHEFAHVICIYITQDKHYPHPQIIHSGITAYTYSDFYSTLYEHRFEFEYQKLIQINACAGYIGDVVFFITILFVLNNLPVRGYIVAYFFTWSCLHLLTSSDTKIVVNPSSFKYSPEKKIRGVRIL